MASRQLQGAIFKYQGTSYMVLDDNQWESDKLVVRSINPSRKTAEMPRSLIEQSLGGEELKAEKRG
jgi:hypothetical protein